MQVTLAPNTAVLTKYEMAHQFGNYNGLFDVNPTLQGIFDIKEKADLFFTTGPGTFTRGSVGSYWDYKGAMQSAAINTPRFNYNPITGELLGLLIEEARTNIFLNSATLSTQDITVTAQAYTVSFYGTGTITFSGAYVGTLVGTGTKERVSVTFTPSAGTVTCTVTGSVTYANAEAGSFATSWIVTTGSSATRSVDAAYVSGSDFTDMYNQTEGTVYIAYTATKGIPLSIDNNTLNELMRLYANLSDTGVTELRMLTGGASQFGITQPDGTSEFKNSFSYSGTGVLFSANGLSAVGASIASLFIPSQIVIGNRGGLASSINGHIKRLIYIPKSFDATTIQRLSA